MPRLELAGGGIFENKYERVVAETQAQLLAFVPEVPHVWGFVRGSSERWYWNGAQWSRAGFVGSGPIASAPPAGNYPAGAMWYDNEAALPWISEDGDWALTSYPDVGDYTILVDENGTILIDDDYAVLVEV